MNPSRIFLSQEALDSWIGEGRADIQGDVLVDKTGDRRFQLREGVRFLAEVTGGEDAGNLVGAVKDLEQLGAMGGEYMSDSVVLGELAYEVQPGFVGRPIAAAARAEATKEIVLPPEEAKPNPESQKQQRQTIMALQAFFLNNVK
ncbi:MAG: hypothetical protein JWM10_327 [Myxococcaceae bacterium]|nr:hypothetical protein [Myxococcaceae bacterium]